MRLSSLARLLILLVSALRMPADMVVAPNEFTSVPSDAAGLNFEISGTRYQNVYNPSEFLTAMPSGGVINQIAFRIDESDRRAFTAALPDVEIRMSTSPSLAPVLPRDFSKNVGSDETVVFPRGKIQFSIKPATTGPNPFSVIFPLKQPFPYDPRNGSLCVDFFIYEESTGSALLSDSVLNSDASSLVAGLTSVSGMPPDLERALVLQFQFQAVPEPAPWIILVLGAVMVSIRKRRR